MIHKLKLLGAFLFFTIFTFAQTAANINCLKFASTTAYEQALANFATAGFNNIEGYSTYQAMKTTFTEPVVPEGIDDDEYDTSNDKPIDETKDYKAYGLLADILNTDKVVIIGNWIVKVDLENGRGLILNTSFSSQYNDVLNDNLINTNIKVVGIGDEGLEILDSLDNPANGTVLERRCTTSREKETANFFYSGTSKRIHAKVVYQRALVYFSLQAKGKCQKRKFRIWWHDGGGNAKMSNIEVKYTKCFGAGFGYSGDPCAPGPNTGQACLLGYEEGNITSYRAYYGGRGLPEFFYGVNFAGTHGVGYLKIKKPD